MSYIYGYRIGAYAGEILLTALNDAGLLSTDFSLKRLDEAISAIDTKMNLDNWVAEVQARE